MVMTGGLHDPAQLASFADGQLSCPFRALGGIHDLVAQLVVANFIAHICQRLCDVCLFRLCVASSPPQQVASRSRRTTECGDRVGAVAEVAKPRSETGNEARWLKVAEQAA